MRLSNLWAAECLLSNDSPSSPATISFELEVSLPGTISDTEGKQIGWTKSENTTSLVSSIMAKSFSNFLGE